MIEEATAPAREHLRHCGIPGGKLFIWCARTAVCGPACRDAITSPNAPVGGPQDGLPRLSLRTLHRTYQTVYRKQPTHNTPAPTKAATSLMEPPVPRR